MTHDLYGTLQEFQFGMWKAGRFYSLPALERAGIGRISRLLVSLRIVLESALRTYDYKKITEAHNREFAAWQPKAQRSAEAP